MGRAVVKVADALIGVFLADGWNAVTPITPLREVKVLDVRLKDWVVEVFIESPGLPGSDEVAFSKAPVFNVSMQRRSTLEDEVAIQLIADHMRNADGFCDCETLGMHDYECGVCRSQEALKHVPPPLLEQARAQRKVAGELVPENPDEAHGEVPGT